MRTSNARLRLRAAWLFRLFILLSAALAIPVQAATITVNSFNQIDPGQCTIATAIASINAATDQVGCTHSGTYGTSDTIVLASGTYASTVINNGTNAYPVINVALTINGNGATLSRTVGAVAPFFRFFDVEAGGLTLNNATLTGGNVPNGHGGAISTNSGPLVVTGSTFSNNTAASGDGGAIDHNSVEAASISNSTFSNNTVLPSGDGGAIFDNSTNGMTLTNTTFTGNTGFNGGAVYDNSSGGLTINNGTFAGSTTASGGDGGAIYDNSSNGLVFNGGSVTNNSSGGNGGGLFDNSTGGLNITNVVFTGNTAAGGSGGAIYDNSSGGLVFNGGSVTNNSVSPVARGGGIFEENGGLQITNVVFTGNTATGGDGGAIFDNSDVGGPVSNNCFVGNTATIGGGLFRGSTPSLNAINNWWGAASGPSGAGPGTGDSVSTNVTFAPFLTTAPAICGGGPPSPGTLQFSLANYSVNEGAGSATITVTRVGGSAGAVGVSFATSNGTATAGSDYTTAAGTLSWADGDAAAKTFVVPIIDDSIVEGNETVNLTLSNPTGGAALGAQATAVLTIIDNDGAIAPAVPVPTLSQWALGSMMLLLLAVGIWSVRRRRR